MKYDNYGHIRTIIKQVVRVPSLEIISYLSSVGRTVKKPKQILIIQISEVENDFETNSGIRRSVKTLDFRPKCWIMACPWQALLRDCILRLYKRKLLNRPNVSSFFCSPGRSVTLLMYNVKSSLTAVHRSRMCDTFTSGVAAGLLRCCNIPHQPNP